MEERDHLWTGCIYVSIWVEDFVFYGYMKHMSFHYRRLMHLNDNRVIEEVMKRFVIFPNRRGDLCGG